MTKRMLIDATHAEETRVAVVDDKNYKLLEFDYENKFRKPLKGSIFLAKVTRVEPSLQAAFVNFGGNRHGFLPFSEIHPDYFRIPISDREALLAEQEELLAEEEEREEAEYARNDGVDNDDSAHDDIEQVDDIDEVTEINTGGESVLGDEDEASVAAEEEASDKKPARGRSRKKTKAAESRTVEVVDDEVVSEEAAPEEEGAKKPAKKGRGKDKAPVEESAETEDEFAEDDDDAEEGEEGAENGEGNGDDRGNKRFRRGGRNRNGRNRGGRNNRGGRRNAAHDSRHVEVLGGTEYEDEGAGNAAERFRFNLRRQYKIQEVIKRGQIMLIQVSREERGNKGAAVSTYLSLPGRYGVLMPNSPRAGGVSRKIAKSEDRQRMRDTLKELDVPKGMSVILRTAGVTRTKPEIKRDVDYLMRLWDDIRERTLQSSAPAMIYEEADLIKRAVRDLYGRDVDEIQVAGNDGFDATKKFMKMMIPSHVKKVKDYNDTKIPLFHKYRVESQISEINEPTAKLKSGGYLVINPTEALVSIDVNSGRATKERHIEETALNTNLEAAEEVARQLRLRDLGGLVVIDFIDMEDRRNNAKVERRLKEALSGDRARIQIGRISSFGLLELSRQRLNPSLTEAQYEICAHCDGRGVVRNRDTTSIMLLRGLEDEGIRNRAAQVIVHVSTEVALYLLNNKRVHIDEIEKRYGFTVLIRTDSSLGIDKFRIEVARPLEDYVPSEEGDEGEERSGGHNNRSGRQDNRRQDNNRRSDNRHEHNRDGRRDERNKDDEREERDSSAEPRQREDRAEDEEGGNGRNRRRGRRGGRNRGRNRNRGEGGAEQQGNEAGFEREDGDFSEENTGFEAEAFEADIVEISVEAGEEAPKAEETKKTAKAKPAARGRKKKDDVVEADASVDADQDAKPAAKSAKSSKADKEPVEEKAAGDVKLPEASNDAEEKKKSNHAATFETVNEAPKSKKKGWWNKLVE